MPDSASSASHSKRTRNLASSNGKSLIWLATTTGSVILADQITKILAVNGLSHGLSVEVLGQFLMFTLVYNTGGAMGTNLASSGYYLISSLLILAFVGYYIYVTRHDKLISGPLSVIAGGAIGNIIDRIRLGMVIDFLDVDFFDIDAFGFHLNRWWTFNLADAAITCGILFMLGRFAFMPKALSSPEERS